MISIHSGELACLPSCIVQSSNCVVISVHNFLRWSVLSIYYICCLTDILITVPFSCTILREVTAA